MFPFHTKVIGLSRVASPKKKKSKKSKREIKRERRRKRRKRRSAGKRLCL